MKRSEFVQIVNEVADSEKERISAEIRTAVDQSSDDKLASLISEIALQIPITAARTCGQIIERSGIAVFDD